MFCDRNFLKTNIDNIEIIKTILCKNNNLNKINIGEIDINKFVFPKSNDRIKVKDDQLFIISKNNEIKYKEYIQQLKNK